MWSKHHSYLKAPAGSAFRADVAVADGMRLPYANSRFDAVLSIAVLHHITSPLRRIHMLAELLRILRPGGKALVTVWATHQEDMKKVAKWQPIHRPDNAVKPDDPQSHTYSKSTHLHDQDSASSGDMQSPISGCERHMQEPLDQLSLDAADSNGAASQQHQQQSTQQEAMPGAQGKSNQGEVVRNDYFVPWHLPFHRAEAAMQVLKANPPQSSVAAGSIRIDNKKNAVVFSRYYHVFEQFELDQLVASVPGAELLDSFYDKDNWCVVMGRIR